MRCVIGLIGIVALAAFGPGCAPELDTERVHPPRGTVGEEMYGVICDRVGAQALREDMTGASFRNICHKPANGEYVDKVDEALLPALEGTAAKADGTAVTVEDQRASRAAAIGRIEALGRRRTDLIRALDATFPETKIAIKDIGNADDTKTCNAPEKSGEGLLTDQIADMLGRMGDLYNDGTLPQSTESLARVMDAFQKSDEAQAAWARLSARQGYRPIGTALGATRPLVAYPHLRDLANASLRLLSADSNPYELDPKYDDEGTRIPVPGPGNAALNKMLEAGHQEMLATKADPKPIAFKASAKDSAGRIVISRPRDNAEMLQEILMASDPAFGGGTARYIVMRDARGYAAIAGGAYNRITNDSLERLMRHDWPGNVRELRNVIAVALAFGKDGPIDLASHLAPMSSAASESTPTRGRTFQDAKREVLARFEREYFTALYAECSGNVSEIGRRAAMERAHVRGYLRRHGIGDPKKSQD